MINTPRVQSDLKYHNLRLAYEVVRQKGSVSRREIAKITGMSPTSMTRIVSTLCECGLIAERSNQGGQEAEATAGRPAIMLNPCPDAAYCLCIDIAVDYCKAVISDMENRFVISQEFDANVSRSFTHILRDINAALPEICLEASIDQSKILACGISVAGHVNNKTGHIIAAGRFDWFNVDARNIARGIFGIPVMIENDCKAALFGEARLRVHSPASQNMVYLKFGKMGVGGAVIIEGQLLRGAVNGAGEIGHMTVLPDGEVCNCGRRGCIETVLSESFIVQHARSLDPKIHSMELLLRAYKDGNRVATDVFDYVSRFIAITINNVSCAYNPDMIVTSGSFLESCPQCYNGAISQLEYQLIKSIHPHIQIVTSKMGSDAAIYGMGVNVIDKYVLSLLIDAPLREDSLVADIVLPPLSTGRVVT